MADTLIENPILNSPYLEPGRHFQFTDEGITNEVVEGRRSRFGIIGSTSTRVGDRAVSSKSTISRHGMTLPTNEIEEFCRRWRIRELSIFGSYLRDDFRPESDIDFLYTFVENPGWSLFDLVRMDEELAAITGRPVDLVDGETIENSENWIRRREILGTAEVIYVAR
jgi:predicted nucleotidyltransferase